MNKFIYFLTFSIFTLISCSENDQSRSNESVHNLQQDSIQPNDVDVPLYLKNFDSISTKELFNPSLYFSKNELDSIIVDLTTYIYKKPDGISWESKFDKKHRTYYVINSVNFELIYLNKHNENSYYFYLLRPAKDANGWQQRGVGGKCVVSNKGELIDLEEIINTKIFERYELLAIGNYFMSSISDSIQLDSFINEKDIIEWPDGQLFYSKEKKEWRYME